jgi:amidase
MTLGPGGKNLPTNASYAAWVGQKSLPNPINDALWNAGCVFYVRTTGPQTLMHLECSSNLYGRTVNPHNRNLTPGGSSGGEGALIGMRGSVLVSIRRHTRWGSYAQRLWIGCGRRYRWQCAMSCE